ncbi:MAG: CapA family protein [Deltaproteobacteria bacterium]|nr:CapA family protein [Deltaproteobacteria bacterium]
MRRLALVAAFLVGCSSSSAPAPEELPAAGDLSADDESGDAYDPYDPIGKADGYQLPKGPVKFTTACDKGDRMVVAAVGDVLLHGGLQQQATTAENRFRSLWSDVEGLLKRADLTYANLEGPTASGVDSSGKAVKDPGFKFDGTVYTSYPQFNYHPFLVDDLLTTGVDVVSTANNHALDRRWLGVDKTIGVLDAAGMAHTGTQASDALGGRWHTVTESAGFRLAWLSCTYATNGIPDTKKQVLNCTTQATEIETMVSELAADSTLDAVIVTPHWGTEYSANPASPEIKLGHRWLEAGATAIIGSHPHVLQPWEKYVTKDGRETFAIYSLGNFVSGQSQLARRSTLLLYMGLTRGEDGKVRINGVRYVPLCMTKQAGRLGVAPVDAVSGLQESRALTVKMFGLWNLMTPTEDLVTTPQCDPDWTPPAK